MRQGTGEVMAQVPLGFFRLPIRNRLHDQSVVLYYVLGFARCRKMEAAQAVDMSAAATYEDPEVIHSGSFVEVVMESLIGCGKGFEVCCLHKSLLLREKALKPGDQPRIRSKRQAPHDLKL
jgi:hypothetical protein